jgi:hypothetical protein
MRRVLVSAGVWAAIVGSACSASDVEQPSAPEFVDRPAFAELGEVMVPTPKGMRPLGESSIRYLRREADDFDDPATPGFDAIPRQVRRFLACEIDQWSVGSETFAVDILMAGLHQGDEDLVDRGVKALDWGAAIDTNDDGVHTLTRDCDGKTVTDYGETHHTTQWLGSLGIAVHLLRASPHAEKYRANIERYIARIEELAQQLAEPRIRDHWETRWVFDGDGNVFTHKMYMRAAALALSASLTDHAGDAARWATDASRIAERAMDQQRDDGVNPERGGYDVSYQMYGSWWAEIYAAILPEGSAERRALESKIDRALDWQAARVDPETGGVDIGESTRVCNANDLSQKYDPAETVRTFLLWGQMQQRQQLIDTAVLVDRGNKLGDPCPT